MPQDHLQLRHDEDVGFEVISAEDIDDYGLDNVVSAIRARVGDTPVYLTYAARDLHPYA